MGKILNIRRSVIAFFWMEPSIGRLGQTEHEWVSLWSSTSRCRRTPAKFPRILGWRLLGFPWSLHNH
ncbi:hypothetical protein Ancab_012087, partial [Ancistrocladus abbreviatus]